MARLIIVSNRVPDSGPATPGGLTVGLQSALEASGGMWFGWSGRRSESPAAPHFRQEGKVSYVTMDLTEEDYHDYYFGFANRALWPLFHYRGDLTTFDREALAGYRRVNRLFAERLFPLIKPGDYVWVHDYHLIPLGEELRRLGCRNPIGFFLHIPLPVPEVFAILPCHRYLLTAMLQYDVVGFQTAGDHWAFARNATTFAGALKEGEDTLVAQERRVRTGIFPIGIDADNFAKFAEAPVARDQAERMRQSLNGRKLIIGVDRLDYTKGLLARMAGFEMMLERNAEMRGRVSMLQVAPPSRADVPEYVDLRNELDATCGRVNGLYGEFDWVPMRYITKGFSRQALAGLLRTSRVGFVTPLRDGMNLVAKEYVAAQDPEDPGVLILSQFAGAAQQLEGAVIINPYDIDAMADALLEGLNMSKPERKQRWDAMIRSVREDDIHHWRRRFLEALAGVER
jgi:trehalose 6-phosphate synthase